MRKLLIDVNLTEWDEVNEKDMFTYINAYWGVFSTCRHHRR